MRLTLLKFLATATQTRSFFNQPRCPQFWPSAALLLAPALATLVPSGYSISFALLFLASLWYFKEWSLPNPLKNTASSWPLWWVAALLAFGLDWSVDTFLSQGGWPGFDKPSKYFLAIPCFLFALRFPPRLNWLWPGAAFGAAASGLIAIWQVFGEHSDRADGFTQVIQFGDLSLLLGLICLIGVGLQNRHWMLPSAFLGFYASFLSGARGGWMALPVLVLGVLIWRYRAGLKFGPILTGLVAGLTLMMALNQGLQGPSLWQRIEQAKNEVTEVTELAQPSSLAAQTSVGQRLVHWKLAWEMILDRPLGGWGESGYQIEKARRVSTGQVADAVLNYRHPHNEILDILVKRGLVGFLTLVFLFAIPILSFWPLVKPTNDPAHRERLTLGVLGLLLPICYVIFGFSQAYLEHNSGTVVYLTWVSLLLARQYGQDSTG